MRQLKITQSITNRRESHTLEKYFTEVSGVPMITPEEEVRLAKLIKKGNQDSLLNNKKDITIEWDDEP